MAKTRRTVMLFLLALFFVLAFSITAWMSNIYKSSTAYSNKTAKSSVVCAGYALSAGILDYSDSSLSIVVRSETFSEETVNVLVVRSGKQQKNIQTSIEPGSSVELEITDFKVEGQFVVYPQNCESFRILCSLGDMSCSHVSVS